MIRVENIYKQFGDVTAVNGVSFKAENGQVTGLLGPNGAGKSTTLRMLYGLVEPDAGAASVDGVYVNDDSIAVQQRIGVLPDTHGLYTRLTAREHIHYFGQLHELDRKTLLETTDHLIELLDMGSIAERRAEGFSQGERMKVCLARALVHQPPNVLLDEPTVGLDVMSTRTVRELIGKLRQENKAVLFSSHLMHEVSSLCDQIVIISAGKVVAQGTPDRIRDLSGQQDLEEAFVTLTERTE
ncbi:MAG: ATP-binding cassette domain-containing protein [Pseudomonadales bacterium]|jgi:sodium transport system ATP-binding protein|nr:ATP-binding cassette domain-containing protein [Pseudomonadales bacterium]MDP7360155.1 ATP-binding cassette domain-containing protein [Pseudomonadales bacterium]MDP7595683.1 ATP-binding cassette domain-containing protein [Pseudomonadales bacterium]HJN51521.1 ATP-binding cassette domain-containing protein [Pseudomonadales bacterium]|tara:strand:- start:929 stop:1651 length:723 start_codon:yes stop_codon:yes gene_type:complete